MRTTDRATAAVPTGSARLAPEAAQISAVIRIARSARKLSGLSLDHVQGRAGPEPADLLFVERVQERDVLAASVGMVEDRHDGAARREVSQSRQADAVPLLHL